MIVSQLSFTKKTYEQICSYFLPQADGDYISWTGCILHGEGKKVEHELDLVHEDHEMNAVGRHIQQNANGNERDLDHNEEERNNSGGRQKRQNAQISGQHRWKSN